MKLICADNGFQLYSHHTHPLTPPRPTLSQLCAISLSLFFVLAHWFQFVRPKYSWTWGHSLEHSWPTSGHTLKENWVSFYQKPSTLRSASAGVNSCDPLHPPWWILADLVLGRSCIGTHISCELMSAEILICPDDSVFVKSSMTSVRLLQPFCLFSLIVHEPWGNQLWYRSSSCGCHFTLWIIWEIPSCAIPWDNNIRPKNWLSFPGFALIFIVSTAGWFGNRKEETEKCRQWT